MSPVEESRNMPTRSPSILVLTCGNPLAGDDALGPAVARQLAPQQTGLRIDVVEADSAPGVLLDSLAGRDAVIVVDAVSIPGSAPGRIVDVDWFAPDRPKLLSQRPLSTHGWCIAQELDLARSLGLLPPHVRLLGATIASAEVGEFISPAVRGCAAAICWRIVMYARQTACCRKELSHVDREQSGRLECHD